MKTVAFLGIAGSFSFLAANKYFQTKNNLAGAKTVGDVFDSLVRGVSDFGVVPIENSTTGSILETYDELIKNNLQIIGEVKLKIHHNLLVLYKNTGVAQIKKCFSHPQAVTQCQNFFESHPWIETQPTFDTATAAKMLRQLKDKSVAAIASSDVAKIYKLDVLLKNIEDNANNFTRFAVIGRHANTKGGKATIAFWVKHVPGSLFNALRPYRDLGLNLTKIESRPIFGKNWEYIFFIDFEIGKDLSRFYQMIERMENVTQKVMVLGLYDKGKIYET